MFDWLIDNFFVTTRQAEFREYLPYVLVIGAVLAWFIRGLIKDVLKDFHRVRRRRWLRFVVDGQLRQSSYWRHYIGEIGPCPESRFRPPWERWLASHDEDSWVWLLVPDPSPTTEYSAPVRPSALRSPPNLRVAGGR